MKSSIMLLLIGASFILAENSFSQEKISLNLNNVTTIEAIKKIEESTNYVFIFNDDVEEKFKKRVSIDSQSGSIEDILNQLLQDTDLAYKINGWQITFFVKKPKANLGATSASNAQQQERKQISGTIVDEKGAPIIGAYIIEKENPTNGTITDVEGNFSIKVRSSKSTLTISSIGYSPQDITITEKTSYQITLKEKMQALDEIVVIGYGESRRRDLTGAISSLDKGALSKNTFSDFSEALQGRIAGVKVTTQSGEAGGSVDIKVRGSNSINASSAPLYVIDGMQIDINEDEVATSKVGGYSTYNPLATINPNDIESIDVLKDASSTAIYGARGANGVIIITTKGASGRITDKFDVNIKTYLSTNRVAKRLEMLTPQEFVDYMFSRGTHNYIYGIDTDEDGIPDTPVDANNYTHYNWQDLMLRNGSTKNIDLSLNAATGKSTNITSSIGYQKEQGLIINNDYERQTGRIKLDHGISEKLKVGVSFNFGRNISLGVVSSGGSGEGGYSGVIQSIYTERPIALYAPGEGDDMYADGFLPLNTMVSDEAYRQQQFTRIFGNAYIHYNFNKHWQVRLHGSRNMSFSKMQQYYSSKSKWGRTEKGAASIQNNESNAYNTSAQLEYNTILNSHSIRAMIGGELLNYHSERNYSKTTDFEDEKTGVFDISKGNIFKAPESSVYEFSRMSAFSRLLYNYKYRYYLTANFRADGSSFFQAGSRVGYFPSLAASWRLNEEPFFKKIKIINNLKLRASAGASGNDRISVYSALARMNANYYASAGNKIMGISPLSSENPDLRWETTYQYNAGLDLDLFESRISAVFDAYYKDTRDMLLNTKVPAQGGFMYRWQNIGRLENKGIEFALITRNIQAYSFEWTTNFNIDFNRNKVLDLGGAQFLPISIGGGHLTDQARVIVGQPIGTGFGYVFDGIYQLNDFIWTDKITNEEIDVNTITSDNIKNYNYTLKPGIVSMNSIATRPGDRKYKDIGGPDGEPDGTITADDRTVISNSNPKFNFGLGNTFKYNDFELSFFFTGSYGAQIMSEFTRITEGGVPSYFNLTRKYWLNRWTPENPSNTYASPENINSIVSSYYVEDGSYIRLQNISLNYNIPAYIVKMIGLRQVQAFFTVNNAYVWTRYSGLDPEVKSPNALFSGYDRLAYPRARTFTFGVNLSL